MSRSSKNQGYTDSGKKQYRNRSNKLRRLAQARRLSNPEYRKRFNEYAKNWQRERRAHEWLLKNGTKKQSRSDR